MSEEQNKLQNDKILECIEIRSRLNGIRSESEILSLILKTIKNKKYAPKFKNKISQDLIEKAEKKNEMLKEALKSIPKNSIFKPINDVEFDDEEENNKEQKDNDKNQQKNHFLRKSKRIDLSSFIGHISDDDYSCKEDEKEYDNKYIEQLDTLAKVSTDLPSKNKEISK